MKSKFILFLVVIFIASNASARITVVPSENDSKKKNLSKNQIGYGFWLGKDFILTKGIFTDNSDYIFNEFSIFYNKYNSGITDNYGSSYSFGYGYDNFNLYASGGYVITDLTYSENKINSNIKQGAGFIGAGAAYKIHKNIKLKLDFMNYKIDFSPTQSFYNKVSLDVRTLTFGLGFYF